MSSAHCRLTCDNKFAPAGIGSNSMLAVADGRVQILAASPTTTEATFVSAALKV